MNIFKGRNWWIRVLIILFVIFVITLAGDVAGVWDIYNSIP